MATLNEIDEARLAAPSGAVADPEPARPAPGVPRRADGERPHAAIIVENMTVPADRRVWQQALALRDDGWRVSVVTPKAGEFRAPYEVREGVTILRHPLPIEARGLAAYAAEYATALACETAALFKLGLKDVDVVQICNPPDFLFLPALVAKAFGGARIVFDHHDLTPELLADKIAGRGGPGASLARRVLPPIANWAERRTFRAADQVISTNGAFRQIAIDKGGKAPNDVTVVYSGPDLDKVGDVAPDPDLRKGAKTVFLWVGVMGSQDGLDLMLEAVDALRDLPGGDDIRVLVAGDGPERAATEKLAAELDLLDVVDFLGFVTGERLQRAFASADIGIGSDPKNPFNDRLAMNKVMEYMAWRLPIAMFDLAECRKIAGDAALYAANNDPLALAANLSNLAASPAARAAKGALGRQRLEAEFCWARQKDAYLNVCRRLLPDVD
ncbi:MAG: glycosyltransferase family 4 protein [Parvularculaceae bacterium]